MSLLTTESLFELKHYFDEQLEATLGAIKSQDSERLIKNKINGFIIAIQDRLFELKPKLMCNGCGRAAANSSQVSQTPLSNTRTISNFVSEKS